MDNKTRGQYRRILNGMKCKTLGRCKDETARRWQLLVRLANADDNGFCRCVTSDQLIHYKQIDAGHFISRRHAATLFEPSNCHPQCKYDNKHRGGVTDEYLLFMLCEYGKEEVEWLRYLSRTQKQWTREELAMMKLEFNAEIRSHERRLGEL